VDVLSPHTLVFYESPYRLESFFKDALDVYGDRRAALANDLTKMFEKVERGSISELITVATAKPAKGEYIIVIAGADGGKDGETGRRGDGERKRRYCTDEVEENDEE
jgi:16S rRNA (cytidine1402-2'-O)-methyltransferase